MTRVPKIERDFARADLASVTGLLAQLGHEDVMARIGLEARRNELQQTIAAFDEIGAEPVASAALFFGGTPVISARGIETGFAGAAVTKFQDIVAKILADRTSGLGERGVVPNKGASTLHITNIVRGSFGFLLEEIQPQQPLLDTALKSAVDGTIQLLDALGEPDEEMFRTAVEATDPRVFDTAREFFKLMHESSATLRVVAGDTDRSFGAEAVARAADRAASTTVEEIAEQMEGELGGVLPDAHQFEFRTKGPRGTIRGRVERVLSAMQLAQFNREYVDIDAVADFRIKRVLRNGAIVRESFVLTALRRRKSA